MARRKNTKFVDPRYFMDEKMEKIEESQWQDNLDADAKCAKKYKRNTPEYEDCLTKEGIPLEEERENALDEKDDSFSKAGEEIEKKKK